MTPLPVGDSKSDDRGKREPALVGGRDDRRGQRMLAGPLDARRRAAAPRLVDRRRRHDGDDARLALGQRAGLVDHERVDLLQALERLGVPDQHAGLAPRPTPTMIDIGVASPSAHGQAMISTATAATRA